MTKTGCGVVTCGMLGNWYSVYVEADCVFEIITLKGYFQNRSIKKELHQIIAVIWPNKRSELRHWQ